MLIRRRLWGVGEAEEEVSLAHDVATVNRDGLTGNITCC